MDFQQRKTVLVQLGEVIRHLAPGVEWTGYTSGITEAEYLKFQELVGRIHQHNGWFTEANVRKALGSWGEALSPANIEKWLHPYSKDEPEHRFQVGVIGAGNIPFVALHDILSVFVKGHIALVKLSKDDDKLIPALFEIVKGIFSETEHFIKFVPERLQGAEAVIATGSNNSARYFNYYFRNVPNIIRSNRNSVAILNGQESDVQLNALGADIFDFFGLGCRNVTKIYVPKGYKLDRFFEGIYGHHSIIQHNKYANNYDYNKAVWLLNREQLLDNNFILLKEDKRISSPTASLFYEFYDDKKVLDDQLREKASEIQCITGEGYLPFGSSQCPMLWDYADGVDTLEFLAALGHVKISNN